MTTFYICRHGQTENNKYGRFSGWIDTPLTDAGINNAKSSATKLSSHKIDKVVSSDLGRAFITAYIIVRQLGKDIEIIPEEALREVNYGDFANMPYAVYPEVSPQENGNFVSPNGESLAQMQRRVLACIAKINKDNPDGHVLLTAHDGTINAIYSNFSGEDIGIVDAERQNAHDFVAKFVYLGGKIISFEEITN